ncbi:hypothetical protein A359_08520 [secondary endosymbiont of Ctenarytaina eucalypti]|uniref:Uncharacterized protein n=1 Tax=secondary endosymbiont of Ctenarytaina eucalypti TaxID=1199245 RepID=J3YSH8_9ENTR|nr:hypothetical protein A359_08520 [secondary endosymbiont of Ctenarytaina eucalypti]
MHAQAIKIIHNRIIFLTKRAHQDLCCNEKRVLKQGRVRQKSALKKFSAASCWGSQTKDSHRKGDCLAIKN